MDLNYKAILDFGARKKSFMKECGVDARDELIIGLVVGNCSKAKNGDYISILDKRCLGACVRTYVFCWKSEFFRGAPNLQSYKWEIRICDLDSVSP